MYLSRLQLNPASRILWRNVVDQPYRLHQLVMQGFPDGVRREDANVLHRLDQAHNQIMLLVQSDLKPAWDGLQENLLLPTDTFDPYPNPAVREIDGLDLANGRIFTFRLRVNPIKRLSSGKGNKPGPRVQLVHEDAQMEWLQRKAEQNGFRLLDTHINPEGKQTDYYKKLTIYTMLVDGRLQITDANKFTTAVQTGIGPAKAFGCGLLSLAPG